MTPRPRKPGNKIRAVAYVRVSSEQQADSGLSLEHQREKCRALATVNDYQLVDVIVDAAESGKSLDRPGMVRVLALADAKKVDAVLVAKLDRITRSVRDLADLLDRFARRGVALVSASESLNTETASGRMVVRMLAVIAEWEREAIGERTRDALTAKRHRGERTSRHAPTGFRFRDTGRQDASGKPILAIETNDAEQKQLQVIADCRAAGYAWQKIADELARLGYTTRSGRPWTLWNVRAVYQTALKNGTISADA